MRSDARFKATAPAESYEWYSRRHAEDIPAPPDKLHNRKWRSEAFVNWSDLRGFADAVKSAFPDLVYFPASYTGGGYGLKPPPEAPVPIFKDMLQCVRAPNHGNVVVIEMRWPWPDEIDSDNTDIVAGRLHGAKSPWFDPPWRLPTPWSRSRRKGRYASLAIRFRGYLHVQRIKQWNGRPYWATRITEDGRTHAEIIPDSWVFPISTESTLDLNHMQEDVDQAFFCESILRIWRKFSTEYFAVRDGINGEVIKDDCKSYEARFGWNALKHGISGSRRFISFELHRDTNRIYGCGPAEKHLKKALASPDLEPFDAYDTPMSWDVYKPL